MVKTCPACKIEKDWEEYSISKTRGTPQNYCKPCSKERGKKYYKYNAHKDWVRKLMSKYNLTEDGYLLIYKSQEGYCAICTIHQDSLDRRLCVDHCHDTNKVRGLLCDSCNTGIGKLGDKAEGVRKALKYLEDNE